MHEPHHYASARGLHTIMEQTGALSYIPIGRAGRPPSTYVGGILSVTDEVKIYLDSTKESKSRGV